MPPEAGKMAIESLCILLVGECDRVRG